MSGVTRLRWIVDPPAPGAWNMAVDESLLTLASAVEGVLRFYEWSAPTVSLGYFQAHGARTEHAESAGCALVRRSTGGGAIVHDRELTYSLIMPADERMGRAAEQLYDAAHETLVETLADGWGIVTALCPAAVRPATGEPFLCFQRRARGDVLCASHKVAGSAQRRHRSRVLQHGSVLLARSVVAPQLPGIGELAGIVVTADELATRWTRRFAARLELPLWEGRLTASECELAERLRRERFAEARWTERR